jgi:hypothetical protein
MGRAHKTAYTYNPSFAATPLQPVFYAEHRRLVAKGLVFYAEHRRLVAKGLVFYALHRRLVAKGLVFYALHRRLVYMVRAEPIPYKTG